MALIVSPHRLRRVRGCGRPGPWGWRMLAARLGAHAAVRKTVPSFRRILLAPHGTGGWATQLPLSISWWDRVRTPPRFGRSGTRSRNAWMRASFRPARNGDVARNVSSHFSPTLGIRHPSDSPGETLRNPAAWQQRGPIRDSRTGLRLSALPVRSEAAALTGPKPLRTSPTAPELPGTALNCPGASPPSPGQTGPATDMWTERTIRCADEGRGSPTAASLPRSATGDCRSTRLETGFPHVDRTADGGLLRSMGYPAGRSQR